MDALTRPHGCAYADRRTFWLGGEELMMTKMRPASDMSAASTWCFEEGRLTVHHLGEKVSLGRYATREHAAKAAVIYFNKHGGQR